MAAARLALLIEYTQLLLGSPFSYVVGVSQHTDRQGIPYLTTNADELREFSNGAAADEFYDAHLLLTYGDRGYAKRPLEVARLFITELVSLAEIPETLVQAKHVKTQLRQNARRALPPIVRAQSRREPSDCEVGIGAGSGD